MAPPTVLDLTSSPTVEKAPRPRARAGGPPPPPPTGGGDGDGGYGGYGGRDEGYAADRPGPEGVGRLALVILLLGVTTLFAVLIAVALLLRRPAPDWDAGTLPALGALWTSSACLCLSSVAVEGAARRARGGPAGRGRVVHWLTASLALGAGFVAAQTGVWLSAWRSGAAPSSSGYAAVFFALTGLHALHVLGGLAFLGGLLVRCTRAAGAPPAASVRLGALYWHFMGALWVVLFALFALVR